jgi:hypothetical protein
MSFARKVESWSSITSFLNIVCQQLKFSALYIDSNTLINVTYWENGKRPPDTTILSGTDLPLTIQFFSKYSKFAKQQIKEMFLCPYCSHFVIFVAEVTTITELRHVNKQNALFKLVFEFSSSCLLHASNILCSSTGRLYCTCSLMWHVSHAEISIKSYTIYIYIYILHSLLYIIYTFI